MTEDKEVQEGKIWAIIAYIPIIFLAPLIVKKDNKFALYHAKQGLILTIVWVVFIIVMRIIWWVPFLGKVIATLCWIVFLALFIVGIINAATGKYTPLPVVGRMAEKWKI